MMDADAVKVHVTNADDFSIQKVEEREPEHFVFSTVVVAFNLPGYNNYEQALPEDPLRKDFSILSLDNPVVICTKAQLTDTANQKPGVPFPQGGLLPAGTSVTGTGTAQIFVVATTGAASRVSLFVNRRNG
jgi:hypothetical protein